MVTAAAAPAAAASGPPGWAAYAALLALQATMAIGGGMLANSGNKETKMERTKRKLVDKLLGSINGSGPYSDLFNMDEDAFQKSFVEPAQARFRNQTAPNIQQQFIASGQHRGTGLDDTLTRAGIDMDQMLNQYYAQYQDSAQNRKANVLNAILGGGSGAERPMSTSQAAGQGAVGYLNSPGFQEVTKAGINAYNAPAPAQQPSAPSVVAPVASPQAMAYNDPNQSAWERNFPQIGRKGYERSYA